MFARRTKIVATLGPATDPPGVLDQMVAAGVDCARLNCSHGTADDQRRRAGEVRAAAGRAGRALGLLFDLQGPKLRLSAATGERALTKGEVVVFTGDPAAADPDGILVDFPDFARLVTERSQIVIGDGVPRLAVERVESGRVWARVVSAGPLAPRKGINVTFARPELPAITDKDVADLALAAEAGADFVALSFVRSAADMEELRGRLRDLGSDARIVAKVEKVEAYEHLDEIIAAADGVMVARGDYGVEAGVARVPLMQKDTIHRATQAGKFVITATQMLESMIQAPEPTRAEVADVANAVIDGSSAVMLSAETSVGAYPVEAVVTMAEIAEAAEEAPEIHGRAREVASDTAAGAVMHAAVELAGELDAAALIVPTSTGGAPRACAKYRRPRPIVALAHSERVADQLTLEWGVYPTSMPVAESVDGLIDTALEVARDFAGLPTGAPVVLTAGRRSGTPGATNLIMVREIP
ncbi:MAG: pyruvate kinase [Solirubrobacteraceae bacterium]|nr:pyruvate kinase [Solirubrobacteraceae bacterium]